MKDRFSHRFIWFELGALLALVALVLLCVPAPHSTAQEDSRGLSPDRAQPTGPSGHRVALVIGNGAYTNAPPLKNPPNDARDMAATLKVLGFQVVSGINVNQRDMKRLIREFGQTLKAGGSGLFYYAGHGVQSKGHNYLVPVDADIQSEAEVEDSGVDVNLVLNSMDDAQNGLNLVILDACRNNPFSRSFRSASSGLAQVDAPTGTLIAYATAPGRVASDGTGQNGLYTSELLKQMRAPGLSATDMFMRVRAEVMKQTDGKQVPWEASSLVGMFYFSAPAKNSASPPTNAAANDTKFDPAAIELSYWESIKNSTDDEDFKAYLKKYPSGAFTELANNRLATLETAAREREKAEAIKKNSLEGTTWRGDSPGGDKHYEFQFLPNGEVNLLWKLRVLKSNQSKSYSGKWRQTGNTIYMEFYPPPDQATQGNLPAEGTISGDKMTGSWLKGYKFTLEKVPSNTQPSNSGGNKSSEPAGAPYTSASQPSSAGETKGEDNANPNSAASLFDQGQAALRSNDVDSAITLLNRATMNDPRLASAWLLLTSAYLRRAALSTDSAKSAADYLNAVRAGEGLIKVRTDAEAVTLFGQALIGSQQYERAAAALERATLQPDAKGVTFYLLGVAQSRTKNFPKAIVALQTAAQGSPDDINIYRELGYAYEVTRQYAKALAAYQKGLSLAPGATDLEEAVKRVRPFAR